MTIYILASSIKNSQFWDTWSKSLAHDDSTSSILFASSTTAFILSSITSEGALGWAGILTLWPFCKGFLLSHQVEWSLILETSPPLFLHQQSLCTQGLQHCQSYAYSPPKFLFSARPLTLLVSFYWHFYFLLFPAESRCLILLSSPWLWNSALHILQTSASPEIILLYGLYFFQVIEFWGS